MFGKIWDFLFGKERGADDIENTGGAMMYLGILILMFVFLGYITQTLQTNLGIADIYSLPVFGPVLSSLQSALQIGGTVLLVLFLITLLGSLVVVMAVFKRFRGQE